MARLGNRIRLGDLLVENNYISESQLQEALQRQKGTDKRIGEILIDIGLVTEKQILELLEFQLGIPHIYLPEQEISREAVAMIPEEMIRERKVFPYKVDSSAFYIAMVDPLDFITVDNIAMMTGLDIRVSVANAVEIEAAIGKYFGFSQQVSAVIDDLEDIQGDAVGRMSFDLDNLSPEDDAPIITAVNGIISNAVKQGASDIHIEATEDGIKVRYRIDGLLQEAYNLPLRILPTLVSRIKLMAEMDIAEKRLPQDGRIQITTGARKINLRISSLPTILGEKLVLRILDREEEVLELNQLGFSSKDMKTIQKLLRYPYGMILVTGPTGSGKTTSLYAALTDIQSVVRNIVTIEDPVEYTLNGINQVQTNNRAGLTFATGLRSILRQDPDVIMVGEIRDPETAEISIRAATTGHLVFSTLHTNNAANSIARLIDMSVEPFLVASSVIGVIAQRLVRRICPRCIEEYKPQPDSTEVLFIDSVLGDRKPTDELLLHRGKGCNFCNQTGYKGRIVISEILLVDPDIRKLIMDKVDTETVETKAREKGMLTMKEDGVYKAIEGLTTIQEVMRTTFEGEF